MLALVMEKQWPLMEMDICASLDLLGCKDRRFRLPFEDAGVAMN